MSLVTCINCGYESYILCCSSQPFLFSYCAGCVPSVRMAPDCQICSKSTLSIFNSVRQRLSIMNPNRNFSNQQQQPGNRCYSNGYQSQHAYQIGNNFNEFQMPQIKQGEHMPEEVFWKIISREGVRRSLTYMAERDYEPYLRAERKKNNIQETPLKQSKNNNWRAQVEFSDNSMSEMSQFEEE